MRQSILLALVAVPMVAFAQPKKLPEAEDPYGAEAPAAKPVAPKPVAPKPAPKDPKTVPNAEAPADPYSEPSPFRGPAAKDPFTKRRPAPESAVDTGAKVPPPANTPDDPYADGAKQTTVPARVRIDDLASVQGLLAVQRLDGWLLADRERSNHVAAQLVAPTGQPTRAWFYLLPAKGEPTTLVHAAEVTSFSHLPGKKLTYQGHKDLPAQLRHLLKGKKSIAIEYSAKAAVPSVSRVDAGIVDLIKGTGVTVRSSETLVQYTKAIWGDAGRTAHYVAAHHLVEMRKDALAFVAKQLALNLPITEQAVQQRLARALTVRGLVGNVPIVAVGVNTADPAYVTSTSQLVPIKRGDLIVISLAAKLDKPDGIWAAQTWTAVAETSVPADYAKAFDAVSLARDQAIVLVSDRAAKRRPVTGADIDAAARSFLKKAGFADRIVHRTGHSIDNDFQGSGADLDSVEVKDTRILTPGTGFTVGPGVYVPGTFGVRSEVSVFLGASGPEITTAAQNEIEAILAPTR